jgi:hypothetical protein
MSVPQFLAAFLVLAGLAAIPSPAADPPSVVNPFKAFTRSPFTAELEVYSGGITGERIGAAYQSAGRGNYGARFTFGFLKGLNFSLNYMYSNQSRSFTALPPPSPLLPAGTLLMRANNLNMFFGNGEFNIVQTKRASFYLSPGVGFARNGSRSMTLVWRGGRASTPIFPGTSLTFNLGAGVKVYPFRHLGFRFDLRDYVSGGGTGSMEASDVRYYVMVYPPPPGSIVRNAAPYFGKIPVQNNVTFTVGLIFKIR